MGGIAFSTGMVAASFVWFFLTDDEIFIPGLAGGELFAVFVVAFLAAVPLTRLIAFVLLRVRAAGLVVTKADREKEPLV